MDALKIEILTDGTIRVVTNAVSGPNHYSAEQFITAMAQLAGGETTMEAGHDRGQHAHAHAHAHAHENGIEHTH